jgi:hypothetical protein
MKRVARDCRNLGTLRMRHSEVIFLAAKRLTYVKSSAALKKYRILSAAFLFLLITISLSAAVSAPENEKQKIEALIKQVSDLKDAKFVRNGATYNSNSAATFLRRKWQANQSQVRTARDFIDKVASISGTSGKPYLIRFKDGKEIHSREFLLAKLKNLED